MGTHPIFESDFDCLTDSISERLLLEMARLKNYEQDLEDTCKYWNAVRTVIPLLAMAGAIGAIKYFYKSKGKSTKRKSEKGHWRLCEFIKPNGKVNKKKKLSVEQQKKLLLNRLFR